MAPVSVSPIANNCTVEATSDACISQINMCSDCSCDQAEHEGRLCQIALAPFQLFADLADHYLDFALVTLSLLANSLLLMTLVQRTFGASLMFMYIRLLAGIGLLSGLLQLIRRLIPACSQEGSRSYATVVIVQLYPFLEDSAKLWFSGFSVFLALDRLLAVSGPSRYAKVNNRTFIWLAFGSSAVVAGLGLVSFVNYRFVYNTRTETYTVAVRYSGGDLRTRLPERVVFSLRLLEMLSLIGLCSATVWRLRPRCKSLRIRLLDDSEQRAERKLVSLCRLQLIQASVAVFDCLLLSLNSTAFMLSSLSNERLSVSHSHQGYLYSYPALLLYYWTCVLKLVAVQLPYVVLLLIYVSCSTSFRQAFIKLITCRFVRASNVVVSSTSLNQVSETF